MLSLLSIMINPSAATRIFWATVFIAFVVYMIYTKSVSMETIERFSKLMSTVGGQVVILCCFTLLFFISAMAFGYYVIDAVQNKTLEPNDTMATVLIEFVTGTAFGTALGALIQLLGAGRNPPKNGGA